MYEHVGLDNYPSYFATIKGRAEAARRLPAPRHHAPGEAQRQACSAASGPEFEALTNYIFPGGELDHIGSTSRRHGAQRLRGPRRRGLARALRAHLPRSGTNGCYANRAEAVAEVGQAKTRIWLLYLAGCSLAFERGTVGIFQTLATRRARGPSGLPPTRADLYR